MPIIKRNKQYRHMTWLTWYMKLCLKSQRSRQGPFNKHHRSKCEMYQIDLIWFEICAVVLARCLKAGVLPYQRINILPPLYDGILVVARQAFHHQNQPPSLQICGWHTQHRERRPQKLIVSHIKSLSTKWQTNYSWDRYFSVFKLFLFLLV
jgi:hypothetical protein